LIEHCLQQLLRGGRLVVNAVTLGGEARLLDLQRRHGGDLARLAVSRAEPIGRTNGWKAMAPVTQWVLTKGIDA
jgi:precorrin-6Y C5,15-methyltransferase (decarboxylating)